MVKLLEGRAAVAHVGCCEFCGLCFVLLLLCVILMRCGASSFS